MPENEPLKDHSTTDDLSATGIHFYNVDWENKTFNYLTVMDDEAMQGHYVLQAHEPSNNKGHFESNNGWRCRYRDVRTKDKQEVVIFVIQNPIKGYNERDSLQRTRLNFRQCTIWRN